MKKVVLNLIVLTGLVGVASARQQGPDPQSYIETVRAGIRAEKVNAIAGTMQFTEEEAEIFWPIYHRYEAEMTDINQNRVAVLKLLFEKYATLSEADAESVTDQMLDFGVKRAELHRKYVAEFRKAGLRASTVAKFMQLEHRLDLMIDAKLAAELPPVQFERVTSRIK